MCLEQITEWVGGGAKDMNWRVRLFSNLFANWKKKNQSDIWGMGMQSNITNDCNQPDSELNQVMRFQITKNFVKRLEIGFDTTRLLQCLAAQTFPRAAGFIFMHLFLLIPNHLDNRMWIGRHPRKCLGNHTHTARLT